MIALLLLAMVLKRPKVWADAYYDKDDLDEIDNPSIPSHVTHKHTYFNINTSTTGYRSHTTTTYHDAPASPQKHRTHSRPDPVLDEWNSPDLSWLDGPILEEEKSDHSDVDDDPSMDPRGSTKDAAILSILTPSYRMIHTYKTGSHSYGTSWRKCSDTRHWWVY